jgi:hypothetical protein
VSSADTTRRSLSGSDAVVDVDADVEAEEAGKGDDVSNTANSTATGDVLDFSARILRVFLGGFPTQVVHHMGRNQIMHGGVRMTWSNGASCASERNMTCRRQKDAEQGRGVNGNAGHVCRCQAPVHRVRVEKIMAECGETFLFGKAINAKFEKS